MSKYRGKTIFITGGANGIGFGIAQAFATQGAKLAIADIDRAAAESAVTRLKVGGIEALAIALNVADPAAWKTGADKTEAALGPVDVLFNNAGVLGALKPLVEISVEDLRWLFDINIFGMIHEYLRDDPRRPVLRSAHEGARRRPHRQHELVLRHRHAGRPR